MKHILNFAACLAIAFLFSGCTQTESGSATSPKESANEAGPNKVAQGPKTNSEPTRNLSDRAKELPAEANVASQDEREQVLGDGWGMPQAVLVLTGEQHGYIEPCGCTGLDNQKGGLIRRDTLLTELRGKGWNLVPLDCGNQIRRIGGQAVIKFRTTAESLKEMGYEAIGFGIDDLQISTIELVEIAASETSTPGPFLSANVMILDPSFFPTYRIVQAGGRKIGVTSVLGEKYQRDIQSSDIEYTPPAEALKKVMEEMQSEGCDYTVVLAHAPKEEAIELAQSIDGVDLIVIPGFGEPTHEPEDIDGSDTIMVQTGVKGMYAGIVGLFDDEEMPVRYQRIALSSQFKDSERMLERFAAYQQKLKEEGFEKLGAITGKHKTGRKFVGSEVCGECHTTAYDIWENSPHVHATESVVAADNERGGIPRHHDPECVSCHSTGWNVERHYPYESGFLNPEDTPWLTGSGCENCHGPGKDHVDAEYGDVEVDNETLVALQQQMVITLEEARASKCIECHDIDNSPDFHPVPDNFDRYWEQVKHYGKD